MMCFNIFFLNTTVCEYLLPYVAIKPTSQSFPQDLMKDLRSELSGDFEDTIIAMMMSPVEYDAYCLHEAMKGLKTDKTTLIGIICSKNNEEIAAIKDVYKQGNKELFFS